MTLNELPKWASYTIAGLASLVMALSGVCATLFINDRQAVATALQELKVMVIENRNIDHKQNIILDRICELVQHDYTQRKEMLKNRPLGSPWAQ